MGPNVICSETSLTFLNPLQGRFEDLSNSYGNLIRKSQGTLYSPPLCLRNDVKQEWSCVVCNCFWGGESHMKGVRHLRMLRGHGLNRT